MIDEQNNLHQLPKGWTWTQLGEIAEIILGQSPPSSTYNESGNGLPFYQGKLEFGKVYPTPKKWCVAPKKMAEKGDVLISVRAPVGPTNICPEKSCIGRGLAAIRGLGGIETFFILYLIRTFENVLAGKGTGTTFNAISGDQLRGLEFPLPPLSEQHRIVAKVEELFTNLDAGVESLKKVKTQLKRYRQTVLKYAFEGKLTEEWRKTHKDQIEPASLLLKYMKKKQNGNLDERGAMMFSTNAPSLAELPDSWTLAHLSDIAEIGQGGTPSTSRREYWNGKVPWLRSGEVNFNRVSKSAETITELGLKNSPAKLLPKGTVLLAMTGQGLTRGRAAILDIEAAANQSCAHLIPNPNLLKSEYLFQYFRKEYWNIRQLDKGSNQPGLNTSIIKRFIIPLPSLIEQTIIIEEIERRLSVADKIENVSEQSLKQAERLHQSILKRAFEGKLVPQDPADEPAEKLLERIKQERPKREIGIKAKKKNDLKQLELMRYVK